MIKRIYRFRVKGERLKGRKGKGWEHGVEETFRPENLSIQKVKGVYGTVNWIDVVYRWMGDELLRSGTLSNVKWLSISCCHWDQTMEESWGHRLRSKTNISEKKIIWIICIYVSISNSPSNYLSCDEHSWTVRVTELQPKEDKKKSRTERTRWINEVCLTWNRQAADRKEWRRLGETFVLHWTQRGWWWWWCCIYMFVCEYGYIFILLWHNKNGEKMFRLNK